MTQLQTRAAPCDPARIAAEKAYREGDGATLLSREHAAEVLRQRGVTEPAPGSSQPTISAPVRTADDYRDVNLHNVKLPEGAEPAAVLDGGRVLAAALQLDPVTAGGLIKDIAGAGDVDPTRVRTLVERCGQDYDELVRHADDLLAGKRLGIKAADLPPHSLLMLASIAQVQAKHRR